jgi:hypothetical protein
LLWRTISQEGKEERGEEEVVIVTMDYGGYEND